MNTWQKTTKVYLYIRICNKVADEHQEVVTYAVLHAFPLVYLHKWAVPRENSEERRRHIECHHKWQSYNNDMIGKPLWPMEMMMMMMMMMGGEMYLIYW